MISIKQVLLGILYYTVGIIFSYIFLIKIGGSITSIFATSPLYTIMEIVRYLAIVVFSFIVPFILLTNSNLGEKMEGIIGI